MHRSLALILMACADTPTALLPVTQAPPAEDFELTGPQIVWQARTATWEVQGVAPGATVYLLVGTPGGSACPPQLLDTCLELSAPQLVNQARADSSGQARLSWITRNAPGARAVQAAWIGGGAGHTSRALPVQIVDPTTTDSDSDGLLDQAELDGGTNPLDWDTDGDLLADGAEARWLRTSPLLYDTDGGGAGDQAELLAETDPRNPADDVLLSADTDGDGIPDCDDVEDCDGLDNDGDGQIDEGMPDADEDGLPDCQDSEDCDGLDNDGDEQIDEGLPDGDLDGTPDCRDTETCDGLDNDGDTRIDEGFDGDFDGIADCFDQDPCDCRDNDLDGLVDETCAYDLGIQLSADDAWELWVDGHPWATGDDWRQVAMFNGQLPAGTHHVAIHTWDVFGNVAGLLGAVFVDGQLAHVTGDAGWHATATQPAPGWQTAPVGMGNPQVVGFDWPGINPLEAHGAQWVWGADGTQPQTWPDAWFVLELSFCGPSQVSIEACDGVDNDGDNLIDEGFLDEDFDGLANCVDADPRCDGLDNDGDGLIDEGWSDSDYDGIADCVDTEVCDGLDNDGDGFVDEGSPDGDYDDVPDCQDSETCDGFDNDGDGLIDEGMPDINDNGVPNCLDIDPDCDGDDDDDDGYVDEGWPDRDLDGVADCQDRETCDLEDNDGDGLVDEGFDLDRDGVSDCYADTCGVLETRVWAVSGRKLWSVDIHTHHRYQYTNLDRDLFDIAFGRDGRLYGVDWSTAWVIDLSTGHTTAWQSAPAGTFPARGLAVHPDGRLLGQDQRRTLGWDSTTGVSQYGEFYASTDNEDTDLTWIGGQLYALGRTKSHVHWGVGAASLHAILTSPPPPAVPKIVLPARAWNGVTTTVDGRVILASDPGGISELHLPAGNVTSIHWNGASGLASPGDVCNGPIPAEVCNGVDDDGDGQIDEGFGDSDDDGVCDEIDHEECDCLDNNGDGVVDEMCTHTVEVMAQADDRSQVYLDGLFFFGTSGWTDLRSATATVSPGLHHVAARATDTNQSAVGFRAAVRVDGALVTATGDSDWLASTTDPGAGWATTPSLFTSPWAPQGTCFGTWRVGNVLDTLGADWIWPGSCRNPNAVPQSWFVVPVEVCGR